jgi:hypothetical protein
MKITKAKLKQIIKEELSAMSEGGAQGHYEGGEDIFVSHHATGDDPAGTSQVLMDALATIRNAAADLQSEPGSPLRQSADLLSQWLEATYPGAGEIEPTS